jgi:hypothetical protein
MMFQKSLISLLILCAFLALPFVSCGGKDSGGGSGRGGDSDDDIGTPDDDSGAADDDTVPADDASDDDVDDDDTHSHWDDDADDDDSHDWPDDDSEDDTVDDDADDDVDDDADDDIEYTGIAVGQNDAGNGAFFGVLQGDTLTQIDVPLGDDVRLTAVDYRSGFGVTVGEDLNYNFGVGYKFDGAALSRLSVTFPSGIWHLDDVSVPAAETAYIVGHGNDTSGQHGIIFQYLDGIVTQMTSPDVTGEWQLKSVSFFQADKGWAVGFYAGTQQPLILGYNGFAWAVYDSPTVDGIAQLLSVDAPSVLYACAVGLTIPSAKATQRGYALLFDGVEWSENFGFPEESFGWYLSSVSAIAGNNYQSCLIKNNQLECWRYDGDFWHRNILSLSFYSNDVMTSVSFTDNANGLAGTRDYSGNSGRIARLNNSDWYFIDHSATDMGNIYDVVAP